MDHTKVRRMRVIHTIILSILMVVLILEPIRETIPYWEFLLAFSVIWVWMLGIRYERSVILAHGLADPEDIEKAERASQQFISWESWSNR